jgi:hypothetical protein
MMASNLVRLRSSDSPRDVARLGFGVNRQGEGRVQTLIPGFRFDGREVVDAFVARSVLNACE